jgi:Cu/Ag efflux protein CusF
MHRPASLATLALSAAIFVFAAAAACAPSDVASGTGKVNAIMAAEGKVNVTHEPIPALDWPGMTMDFRLAETATLEGINVGDTITFRLRKGDDGVYEIESLSSSMD